MEDQRSRRKQAEQSVAAAAASGEDAAVGDIVVMAQRRSESIQNVPIAIAAFHAASLERQQIRTTSVLQMSIPSVPVSTTLLHEFYHPNARDGIRPRVASG